MRQSKSKSLTATTRMAARLAGSPPARVLEAPGRFTPCANAPHCVSSQADPEDSHYVAPFKYSGETAHARSVLLHILTAEPNARIVRTDDHFIHATFHTRLGFVDDVVFLIQPQDHMIDVKSASRIGYYDFGVNRRRVKRLRKRLQVKLRAG